MKAQELKHIARLEEWKGRVRECRSSGQSVRSWCKERGIAYKTYYYWEKEVLSEAGCQMGALESGRTERFVAVPALPPPEAASESGTWLAAKLRIKGCELEVYTGADEQVLKALLQVMKDVE